jgi:hypothetical protein
MYVWLTSTPSLLLRVAHQQMGTPDHGFSGI